MRFVMLIQYSAVSSSPQEYLVVTTQLCLLSAAILLAFFNTITPLMFNGHLPQYYFGMAVFSGVMAVLARKAWRRVENQEEEEKPLLPPCGAPPKYTENELLF
ncbi:unnamed protein product, partial [Mesorhabditis spiculigera]